MRLVTKFAAIAIALAAGGASDAYATIVNGTLNGPANFSLDQAGGTAFTFTMTNLETNGLVTSLSGDFLQGNPNTRSGTLTAELNYDLSATGVIIPETSLLFDTTQTVSERVHFLEFGYDDGVHPEIVYDFYSSAVYFLGGSLTGSTPLFLNLYVLGTLTGSDGTTSLAGISFTGTNNGGGWTGSFALAVPGVVPQVGHDTPVPEPTSVGLLGAALIALRRFRVNRP